jgi:hypothetical protein
MRVGRLCVQTHLPPRLLERARLNSLPTVNAERRAHAPVSSRPAGPWPQAGPDRYGHRPPSSGPPQKQASFPAGSLPFRRQPFHSVLPRLSTGWARVAPALEIGITPLCASRRNRGHRAGRIAISNEPSGSPSAKAFLTPAEACAESIPGCHCDVAESGLSRV